jgi:hypothetical protein
MEYSGSSGTKIAILQTPINHTRTSPFIEYEYTCMPFCSRVEERKLPGSMMKLSGFGKI